MGCCCGKSTQKKDISSTNGNEITLHEQSEQLVSRFDNVPPFVPTPVEPSPMKQVQTFVTLYDYAARTDKDLGFAKGDVFEILDGRDDAWWLVRSISHPEREGYIPSNHIAEQRSIEAEEWYFQNISRNEATKRLMETGIKVGTFLIRNSEANPQSYSLSMRDIDEINGGEHVKHYKITNLPNGGGHYISQSCQFRSVSELVDHYQVNSDGLNMPLSIPCPKVNPTTIGLSKDAWEIDRSSLKFEYRLGTGQFGEVWKGTWNGSINVAIKTMKSDTMDPSYFLAEANIMKTMTHKNLVQLFAICSDREPIYIVTELMERGSLLDHLMSPEGRKYALRQLLDIAAQIANGMAYLERNSFVHRDLAARNVLVNQWCVYKVADFGLARVIEDYYQHFPNPKKQLMFPIKWTAPEAAFYGRFTTKSDVWSYGILLTEIMTYGQPPYPDKTGDQVLRGIEQDKRMEQLPGCPDALYNTMLQCWSKDPRKRPTFEYLNSYMDDFFVATEHSYRDPKS